MLVITRYPGQSVLIATPDGYLIRVEFIEHRSSEQVRIGFEARSEVRIFRAELFADAETGAGAPSPAPRKARPPTAGQAGTE